MAAAQQQRTLDTPGRDAILDGLTTLAVFQPLLQGSATGMIVATVWRYRRGSLAGREIGGVAMALLAHIAFSLGTILLKESAVSPLLVLAWQAVVVVRYVPNNDPNM